MCINFFSADALSDIYPNIENKDILYARNDRTSDLDNSSMESNACYDDPQIRGHILHDSTSHENKYNNMQFELSSGSRQELKDDGINDYQAVQHFDRHPKCDQEDSECVHYSKPFSADVPDYVNRPVVQKLEEIKSSSTGTMAAVNTVGCAGGMANFENEYDIPYIDYVEQPDIIVVKPNISYSACL